ncbi:MAG: hypothetical protein KGL53_15240 [Elusimicrobia bacterium]|nr:hypothetical protein [Elusimicrobiota bacterium]
MLKLSLALLLFPVAAPAAVPALKDLPALRAGGLRDQVGAPPSTPAPVEIREYRTEETFPFQSDAEEALAQRQAAFQRAGLKTLGGRAEQTPANDWTFVLEYLPALPPGQTAPAAVSVGRYACPGSFWPDSAAQKALAETQARLDRAGLAELGGALTPAGSNSSFTVDYLLPGSLGRAREDEADIRTWTGGRYTFESDAKQAAPALEARFTQAGAAVLRSRAVERPDHDYSLAVEYVTRTNAAGFRPSMSFAHYDSQQTFPFDSNAAAAAQASLSVFQAAGVRPVSAYSRAVGNGYSFGVDYLVGLTYRRGQSQPSLIVQTYSAPETYTFESQAKQALAAKTDAFRQAGIAVIEGRTVPAGSDYSYTLDYFTAPQPLPGPNRPGR